MKINVLWGAHEKLPQLTETCIYDKNLLIPDKWNQFLMAELKETCSFQAEDPAIADQQVQLPARRDQNPS